MRSHTIIGILFIIIMLIAPIIFLMSNFHLVETEGETITVIKTGNSPPKRISVDLGNGLVVIRKNTTVSGWRTLVKYEKNKEKPEISYYSGELLIKLKDGKIIIDYNSTKEIHTSIMNGALNVIAIKSNINVSGSILNGNANFVFLKSNITVDFKLTNGDISINSVATRLIGQIQLINGHINAILEPLDGGTVNYSVDNGEAIVYPSNFNITFTRTKNGEFGTIYSEGNGLNVTMHVTNGGISIIIVSLKEMEEKP